MRVPNIIAPSTNGVDVGVMSSLCVLEWDPGQVEGGVRPCDLKCVPGQAEGRVRLCDLKCVPGQ